MAWAVSGRAEPMNAGRREGGAQGGTLCGRALADADAAASCSKCGPLGRSSTGRPPAGQRSDATRAACWRRGGGRAHKHLWVSKQKQTFDAAPFPAHLVPCGHHMPVRVPCRRKGVVEVAPELRHLAPAGRVVQVRSGVVTHSQQQPAGFRLHHGAVGRPGQPILAAVWRVGHRACVRSGRGWCWGPGQAGCRRTAGGRATAEAAAAAAARRPPIRQAAAVGCGAVWEGDGVCVCVSGWVGGGGQQRGC